MRLHEGEVTVGAALARGLVTSKFPQWSNLVLTQVESTGTDSIIFRLGERMGVRFPRIEWAVDQIGKEFDWLSVIGPQVSVTVPRPVARGEPGLGYPWPWLVYSWVET